MKSTSRPHFTVRCFLYIAMFAAIAVLTASRFFIYERAPMLAQLRDSGIWTQGEIGDSRCQKSLHFDYTFVVSGGHFSGVGTAPPGCCVDVTRSVCEQFAFGRPLRVIYLAEDPGLNFASDPGPAYEGVLIGSSVCAMGTALMVCIFSFIFARNNTSVLAQWMLARGF